MLASDVRHAVTGALVRAGLTVPAGPGPAGPGPAGPEPAGPVPASSVPADPGLRPTGVPGQYAASVALILAPDPVEAAGTLAAALTATPWIKTVEVSGPGYLTITVTAAALAAVADRVTSAGPACVTSDALHASTVPAPPPGDPLSAATWAEARSALAARVTARLATAAGATVAQLDRKDQPEDEDTERSRVSHRRHPDSAAIGAAVSFAGPDAVLFSLARAIPGKPVRIDPAKIARHVLGNPAYAVRYAHARAASGVRWAAAVPSKVEAVPWRPPADQGELALLDALSWLPERVAIAARRGRPDEFARYLEELASATITALTTASHPGHAGAPGTDRLGLAAAARTGLAAGLGLLGVSAPERL